MRGIPSQCQLGPSLSGPHGNRDLFRSSRPHPARCLPPSVKPFCQAPFFWWPSFPGTDDTHTRPGCFAWQPARGWHSTPVTSLSLLPGHQAERRWECRPGFHGAHPAPLGLGWPHGLPPAPGLCFPGRRAHVIQPVDFGTIGKTACLEAGG